MTIPGFATRSAPCLTMSHDVSRCLTVPGIGTNLVTRILSMAGGARPRSASGAKVKAASGAAAGCCCGGPASLWKIEVGNRVLATREYVGSSSLLAGGAIVYDLRIDSDDNLYTSAGAYDSGTSADECGLKLDNNLAVLWSAAWTALPVPWSTTNYPESRGVSLSESGGAVGFAMDADPNAGPSRANLLPMFDAATGAFLHYASYGESGAGAGALFYVGNTFRGVERAGYLWTPFESEAFAKNMLRLDSAGEFAATPLTWQTAPVNGLRFAFLSTGVAAFSGIDRVGVSGTSGGGGSATWTASIPGRAVAVGPGDAIYFGGPRTAGKSLYKYNAAGSLQWSLDAGSSVEDLCVDPADGSVYVVGARDNAASPGFRESVKKYSSAGSLLWTYDTGRKAYCVGLDSAGLLFVGGLESSDWPRSAA